MNMQDTRDISTLHEWKDNPRSISPKDFERLKGQITKLGQYKPLLITKDGEVIGGNMRLKAYNALGIKDIWVSVVEPKDNNQKLEYALSDNDRAGYYDDDMLANLIPNYDIDWSQYAVDMKPPEDIQHLINRIAPVEEDEVPEVPKEAISKLGEVYQLGRHRLVCGNSTKIEDVEKLMDGKKADITFHSPPYNVGHNLGYDKKDSKYINSKDDDIDYQKLLVDSTNLSVQNSEYAFINLQFLANNKLDILDYLYTFRNNLVDICIWHKQTSLPAQAKNVLNSDFELIVILKNEDKPNRAINTGEFWGNISNVYLGQRQHNNEFAKIHNATFPVAFATHFIKNFSKESVIDLFGGSGTTLIACEQTNRICYSCEIDNKYTDVIIKRWMKFTGKRAYKIIDAYGKPCNEPVRFADESFMGSTTLQGNTEAK